MLVTIITGEGETANDVKEVCNRLVETENLDVKEINQKMRFTPLGEEKETSLLMTVKRNLTGTKGVLNV